MRLALRGKLGSPAVRIGAVAAVAMATAGTLGATAAGAAPSGGGGCSPTVSRQNFGSVNSSTVYRYTLTNCRGMQVKILTYGGIVQSIDVPGRGGNADVVLGFKTLQDYVKFASPPVTSNGGPYFGEIIGRYANRIANGSFKLNGKTYTLQINNGVNSLHGGLVGFGNKVWASHAVHGPGIAGVALRLVSPNGDGGGPKGSPGCEARACTGYPAQLTVTVVYTLNNRGQLGIHYVAHNDSKKLDTVLNLTNHSYFNLAGEGSPAGSAYHQFVQINANRYSPTDTGLIPLPLAHGVPVAGTPMDFRTPHTIGERIDDVSAPDNVPASFASATGGKSQLLIAQGYDHNWILNPGHYGPYGLNLAARAWDPRSGRHLTVWTDQPGVQFYSGNFLNGSLVGISGHTYRQSAGYTFETQHFPNSPNEPDFPTTTLGHGKTFTSTTIFAFGS